MTNVVPIFDESDGFIGLWMRNRQLEPSLGALAELMSLAEPTFEALDNGCCTRSENHGVVRVGDNISFQDGAFLMLNEERPPPAAISEGKSFVAISYHGISIAKRTDARSYFAKRWWQFWK